MKHPVRRCPLLVLLAPVLSLGEAPKPVEMAPSVPVAPAAPKGRALKAAQVFDLTKTVIFQDAFSGDLMKWIFSEDDRYGLALPTPDRIRIADAPGLEGKKAVRFEVKRGPNSFRSELSLPHEKGFQERWYGERILVPKEWVTDPGRGNDIVMQWHAIPGNGEATYPNLEISIGNDGWFVRQSFGSAQAKPTRSNVKLDDPARPGEWVSWVVHAKWSPNEDGLLEIWKDGKRVIEGKGPNVYGTIGVDYTPYLKTGIYHPEWHLSTEAKRHTFEEEKPAATLKVIYAADFKMGGAGATYADVAPKPLAKE